MKKFCADLKKLTTAINTYEKNEMLSLTNEEIESCNTQKFHDVDDCNDDGDRDDDKYDA